MKFKEFLINYSLDSDPFLKLEGMIAQGHKDSMKNIDSMIDQMKGIFSKMEKIDPTDPKVLKVRELLKKLDEPSLNKIIDANVKFLRVMAETELRNRKK